MPSLNCTKSGGTICESGQFGILDNFFEEAIKRAEPVKCKTTAIVLIPLIIVTCLAVSVLTHILFNTIKNRLMKETGGGIDLEEESPM